MFNKSFLVQPTSGFVPFSDLAADSEVVDKRETVVAPTIAPTAAPSTTHWAAHADMRPTWQAPAGAGVRRVEMVILASICGYFTFGLGSLLGLY